eukprot:13061228-Alexandrium_andersonii.AAC.1
MWRFVVLPGQSLEMRASRLTGKLRAPSWPRRLSMSAHRAARPWRATSSRVPAQTPRSSSADR